MAELQFRVSADWQEVERLVHEIDGLKASLSKIDTNIPRSEIDKLNSQLTSLIEKYHEVVEFAEKANADLSGIFGKNGALGGTGTINLAQGVSEDMNKIQTIVSETFNALISKVNELKSGISETFGTIGEIKISAPSVSVIDDISEKTSTLNREVERQQLNLANQVNQNNVIISQQQQETMSVMTQGQQVNSLVDGVRERVEVETEIPGVIDSGTESVKKQTDAIKEQTEAVKENRKEKETPIDSYSDKDAVDEQARIERLKALREKEKEYNDMVANAPSGSAEQERYLSLLQGVQAQIKELEEGEKELINQIKEEENARRSAADVVQQEYAYLDDLVQKQKDGTLSEQEYLDTIEKVNQEIQTRNNSINDYREKLEGLSDIESKYEGGVLINADEIDDAISKSNEYNQQIDLETERITKLKSVLSELTGMQVSDSGGVTTVLNDIAEGAERVFNIYDRKDESGNFFRVMANNAEEADENIQAAKDSLEAYPRIMERILAKAEDMRLNVYMTDQGEALVKEAERISKELQGKSTVSQMFGANGEQNGINDVNRLSEIEEKLESIHAQQKEIEEENQRMAETEEQARLKMEEHAQSAMRLRTQVMQAREELARMIAEGKKGTPEFQNLADKAANMQEQLQIASATLNYYGDPNRHLTTLKVGLQGVAGAAGLVTSVFGLVNEDSKKMIELQTKIQSVLGIVIGLETTYNLVKKTSVVMLALEEVKTWTLAKARGVQTAATVAATGAQEALNASMRSNPIGAVISLLAILGTAIYAIVKALSSETEEEKKAADARKQAAEEARRMYEIWQNSATESASKQIIAYRKLQDKWNELGTDLKKKEQFVRDNKKAFNDLGFAVNSVTDAENILVKNTDAVVNSIMARAKAAAYQELAAEEIKKQVRLQTEQGTQSNGKYRKVYKEGQRISLSEARELEKESGIKLTGPSSTSTRGVSFSTDVEVTNEAVLNNAAEEAAKKKQKRHEKEKQQAIEQSQEKVKLYQENAKKEYEAEKNAIKQTGVPEFTPTTSKSGGGGDDSDDALQRRQKEYDTFIKNREKQQELAQQSENAAEEARIAGIQNAGLRERAERQNQFRLRQQQIDDQIEAFKKQNVEAEKEEWSNKKENKGKIWADTETAQNVKKYGYDNISLTADQSAIIKSQQEKLNAEIGRNQDEQLKRQNKATVDLLKAWGDYEQQKLAITQEYEEKIKDAMSPQERAGYVMQRDKELEKLNNDKLFENIDWDGVFSDLQGHSEKYLIGLRDQLQELLKNGQVTDVTQMATLQEKIYDINEEISKQGGLFDFVGERQREHNRLVEEAIAAEERRKTALEEQLRIEQELQDTESSIRSAFKDMGLDEDIDIDLGEGGTEDYIRETYGEQSEEYKKLKPLLDSMATGELKLADARKKTAQATKDAEKAEDKKDRKPAQAVADWFSDAQEFIQKKGIDQIPELMNTIGLEDIGNRVQKGLDGFNDAAGAAKDFASGNYIGAALKGISAVNNVGEALGLWSNSNVEESEKEIDRLIKSNAELGKALDDLRNEMKDINLSDLSAYTKAQEVAGAQIANGLKVVQTKMGEYEGHHSTNYYSDYATSILKSIAESAMRQGIIDNRKLSNPNQGINTLLTYLTPDELDKLRTFDPQGWIKFMNALRDADKADLGAADTFLEYVDNYSDLMEELENEWKETMLNLSWDSLKDSFRSALEDMEKDIESWNDDLDDIFRKGVSNYLSTTYTNKDTGLLAKWYEKYFKAMESGGLDANEVARLREEYLAIVQEATAERDRLYETLGIVESTNQEQQSATFNSAQNITYEQADAIVGIETAQLIVMEQSKTELSLLNVKADQFSLTQTEQRDIAADSRDILAGMAIHVEEIRDGVVDTIVPRIKNIDNNLNKVYKLVEAQ